jgi:hypothetical protein
VNGARVAKSATDVEHVRTHDDVVQTVTVHVSCASER